MDNRAHAITVPVLSESTDVAATANLCVRQRTNPASNRHFLHRARNAFERFDVGGRRGRRDMGRVLLETFAVQRTASVSRPFSQLPPRIRHEPVMRCENPPAAYRCTPF